jgi:tetraacyldisaccharide 4'-kinase
VRDLIRRLIVDGRKAGILSRGYGGTAQDPLKVDPERHDASLVGDEPLLLAQDAPCWVARDRAAGAKAMIADGVDVIVMDDGLQNPSLAQDLRIIVAEGPTGFGNGRPIPAGPLRERVEAGIRRADALIVAGDDRHALVQRFRNHINILHTSVTIRGQLPKTPLLAFAGIGRPEKFRTTLAEAGANIAAFQNFADHHAYTQAELSWLAARAREIGAQLVTTEKDWVRLDGQWRSQVKAIGIDVVWHEEPALAALLNGITPNG